MTLNTLAPSQLTNALISDNLGAVLTKNNGTAVSALLELQSTDGALLIPRMTTVQKNLLNATAGMMVFDLTLNEMQLYKGGNWVNVALDLNFEVPTYAATTANLNAVYDNGTIGVGAVLSNNGALVTFTVDGLTPALGSRILVKNQSSTLQNGIYILTQVGSGSVPWILTRAADYDDISEIKPGNFVLVNFGTVNSNSAWIQTDAVTAIGVDPIQFSQFAANGIPFLEIIAQNSLYVGTNAGNTNGTPARNTGMGEGGVLHLITGVNDTTSVGYNSGHALTVGVNNTLYGSRAGQSLVSGNSSVALGYAALQNNTIQDSNIAIGDSALKALNDTLGISNQNIFIGQHAGQALLDGNSNVGIGASVMSVGTTSNIDNIAIGRLVLNNISNSSDNVSIGTQSGQTMTAGTENVFIGTQAGSAFGLYTNCTFVGDSADATGSNLINSGAFGSGATVSNDNSINIGNGCFIGLNNPLPLYNLDISPTNNNCSTRLAIATVVPPTAATGVVQHTYTAQTANFADLSLNLLSVSSNKSVTLEVTINGATTTLSDFTGGNLVAGFKNAAGTLTMVGVNYNKIVTSVGDFSVGVSGTGVVLHATGIAASTYNWTIHVKYQIN